MSESEDVASVGSEGVGAVYQPTLYKKVIYPKPIVDKIAPDGSIFKTIDTGVGEMTMGVPKTPPTRCSWHILSSTGKCISRRHTAYGRTEDPPPWE
jgi:hypothetical protein